MAEQMMIDQEKAQEEDDGEEQQVEVIKGKIWDEKKQPLQEGEELEYDGSAYVMLHRSKVEWPCLSVDYLVRELCTADGFAPPTSWFPA